jgi:UDP-2,3-diacylglucosamine hydrolase
MDKTSVASAPPTSVLFVADCHFHARPGAQERGRLDRFLAFLEFARRADRLVLLGDIFDFWFDYPHFRMKGYREILQALDRVAEAGTRLTFVGGNHDIWAAPYLHERYGTSPDGRSTTLEVGGLRVRLCHGDGILGKDWLYGTFRAIVRHPVGVLIGKSIHPELLFRFSNWLSGTSRQACRDEAETMVARAERWLARRDAAAWDILVIGHVHHPFRLERHGRILAALGGWLDREGYALLRGGEFQLLDFARDPLPDLSAPSADA